MRHDVGPPEEREYELASALVFPRLPTQEGSRTAESQTIAWAWPAKAPCGSAQEVIRTDQDLSKWRTQDERQNQVFGGKRGCDCSGPAAKSLMSASTALRRCKRNGREHGRQVDGLPNIPVPDFLPVFGNRILLDLLEESRTAVESDRALGGHGPFRFTLVPALPAPHKRDVMWLEKVRQRRRKLVPVFFALMKERALRRGRLRPSGAVNT